MTELTATLLHLRTARRPENVFGSADLAGARRVYHRLAQQVHPDHNPDQPDLAREAMSLLTTWWERFERQLTGPKPAAGPVSIQARRKRYTVTAPLAAGEVADLYYATDDAGTEAILKIARDPADNDLLANEQRMLDKIATAAGPSPMDVTRPDVAGSFMLDGRKVLVFKKPSASLVSLANVMHAYPGGIDCRDMVWMWKRVLGAVGLAHECGVVHGALLPPHILLDLKNHGCHLVGWTAAAEIGGKVKLKHLDYLGCYPPEAPEGRPQLDLFMLAKSMRLAADRNTIPLGIDGVLAMCCAPRSGRRPRSALVFHELLDQVLRQTFGRPKFRRFSMPEGSNL